MENAQVLHLAEHYDLSRDSRLARAIVRFTNDTLDAEERRRQVVRVRPGELFLETRRGPLILPIRTEEYIRQVLEGERWDYVRADILRRCEAIYRKLFPKASSRRVESFLRLVWPGHGPHSPAGQSSPLHGPRRNRPWQAFPEDARPLAELEASRARCWAERGAPRPAHLPETFEKLAQFLGTQAGVPPAIREPMILELMAIRARFCPRASVLTSGQMPLAAMSVEVGRNLFQPSRHQPLAPVVVSLLADGEARTLRRCPPGSYDAFLEFQGRRMARILQEAYVQDGLLSFAELQWVFLASTGTVSRAVDFYQRKNHVILPCPGTVLDMGRMLTHKELVVRLHLQGLSVLEIARRTYHSPRSVDAYLKSFDSVLILHLYGLPPKLMAAVLGRGQALVDEYLDLIGKYLKDLSAIREHLRRRGLHIPANVSHAG